MLIQSLGRKDSPGEGNGNPHSSILALEVPWTEEPGALQSMGVTKSQTQLSTRMHTHTHTCTHTHRKSHPLMKPDIT